MGTGEFSAGGNLAMDRHPIQGGVEILLVNSSFGDWDTIAVADLGEGSGGAGPPPYFGRKKKK